MTNEDINDVHRRKAEQMYRSMVKKLDEEFATELSSGSVVLPESVYASTTAPASSQASVTEESIRKAIHELRKIEEKYDPPPEVIVMTEDRFMEIAISISEENAKKGITFSTELCYPHALYGIPVETFPTQQECVERATELAKIMKRVVLIEE